MKGKITDLWREAVQFQEDTLMLVEEKWREGHTTPSLLFLKTTVSSQNVHLFSEDRLGQEGTLLYHVDNFLPLNQDADMLLVSLERLYGVGRSEIDVMLQAMADLEMKESDRKKALFYVLMDNLEQDIDSYLEDYISLLVVESHANSVILICEADMDDGGDCLHCYLEMEDGRIRVHNIQRWGPEPDDMERIILEDPSEEDMHEHVSLGPFFHPYEEQDDSLIICE